MSSIILPGNASPSQVIVGQTFSAGSNFNTAGTMPNNGTVVMTPTTANQNIASGYHNGTGYVKGDTNLTAGNIKSGVTIFGVSGGYVATTYASGTVTSAASGETSWGLNGNTGYPTNLPRITVSGLTFTPSRIVVMPNSISSWQFYAYDSTTNYITGANYKWWMLTNVSTLYTVIADVTITAYINSTGFVLPVFSTSMSYKWYAYA